MKKLIRAENICKGYISNGKYHTVLTDISLDIYFSQTLAITGNSGIGKSTILRVLGTLDKPDSGKLFCEETNILKLNNKNLARFRNKTIGFIFQFHHLLNNFTAIENTMIPALIGRVPTKKAKHRAEQLLIRVNMKDRMNHKPRELSGGERQRVAIARALIQNPLILLADEPTGNLDKKNSSCISKLLLKLNKEIGMALIVVTHDSALASCMSKRVTISEGKLSEVY